MLFSSVKATEFGPFEKTFFTVYILFADSLRSSLSARSSSGNTDRECITGSTLASARLAQARVNTTEPRAQSAERRARAQAD